MFQKMNPLVATSILLGAVILCLAMANNGSLNFTQCKSSLTTEILEDQELFEQWFIDKHQHDQRVGSANTAASELHEFSKCHPEKDTLVNLRMRKAQESFTLKAAGYGLLKTLGDH